LPLSGPQLERIVENALAEDLSWGDITTDALIPYSLEDKATILAKSEGVLAGAEVAALVFNRVDSRLKVKLPLEDGTHLKHGDVIATVTGSIASILRAERTALNFLQRLSGIATETSRYVEAVKGCKAVICDTRKTTPGLRFLEKYAVHVGGGRNHRHHLGDGVLIKDNHLAALARLGIPLAQAVRQARERAPHELKVEVEVTSPQQAKEAAAAGADIVMLDNMNIEEMRQVARELGGKVLLEASGGITLQTVRSIAETGVDVISVGALTHSAHTLDISLELATSP
jgi:nicotinate-nucleotide pyrophosphorylase (carboxylating)